MGKNLESKCRQCRRIGEKLFLKGERCNSAKCAMVKRNYPPGFHGPKGRKRQSDFALQLNEKQKARKQYGLLEKQFRLTFERAQNQEGDAGKNFLKLLEMRLDNVVYRIGFAASRVQARQLVNHGHILVNGRRVDIPSFTVKVGDIISIGKSSRNSKHFRDLFEKIKGQKNLDTASWLHFNIEESSAKVLHEPGLDDVSKNINVQMIIEFYSK